MRYSGKLISVIFGVLLMIFIFGIVHLLILRFKGGDVYPPYSSLRSDPMGTLAFYESLRRLKTVTVQRNHRSLSDIPNGKTKTVFYLGASARNWMSVSEDTIKTFDRLAFSGSRLILSFRPQVKNPRKNQQEKDSDSGFNQTENKKIRSQDDTEDPEKTPPTDSAGAETDKIDEAEGEANKRELRSFIPKTVSLKEHWGIQLEYHESVTARDTARPVAASDRLPTLSWHTAFYFDKPPAPWRIVYAVDDRPVLLERKFGRGSIVLSADSYFFSNEALFKERHSDLLVWLVGPNFNVVFDESHFGIVESQGISTLIRKHRLHWFLLGMVIVAILFIWKNSVPLIPVGAVASYPKSKQFETERDFTQGLISLLRRNVPVRQILGVCVVEWKKSFAGKHQVDPKSLERIESLVVADQSGSHHTPDPVGGYRRISRILAQKGKYNG